MGTGHRAIVHVAIAIAAVGCESGSHAETDVRREALSSGGFRVSNGPSGAWSREGAEPWRLVEDLRIGALEGDGPDVFGWARNLVVLGDTLIWVMDSQALEMHAFDRNGDFVRTVGGPGRGPGEFPPNPCAHGTPFGEIWVEARGTWQRFAADGSLLGTVEIDRTLGCGMAAWNGDRFVAASPVFDPETRESEGFFRVYGRAADGTFTVTETVVPPPLSEPATFRWMDGDVARVTLAVPLVHNPRASLQEASGEFIATNGGEGYEFWKQGLSGDTVLVVSREYVPVPVSSDARSEALASLDLEWYGLPDDYDPDLVPTVFPPFEWITESTDGTFWAYRQVGPETRGFDVFAADGVFLGTVELSSANSSLIVHEIGPDYVYGVVRDELDVQYVVRLRIDRAGGERELDG